MRACLRCWLTNEGGAALSLYTRRAVTSIVVMSSWLLLGCGFQIGPRPAYPRWQYVVPDNYEGYVAIHYQCAAGQPLVPQQNVYTVVFDDMGVFCTSSSPVGILTEWPTVQTRNGTPLSYENSPTIQGYGLCCINDHIIGGGTPENPGPPVSLRIGW
jgi:hypothetical protein